MWWLFSLFGFLIVFVIVWIVFLYWLLVKIFDSIQAVKPTAKHSNVKDACKRNPLFKYFPSLETELAWEELGVYPTPIHKATLDTNNGKTIQFWMKREDLSSQFYGGNKVRTLQYQIPACRILKEQDPSTKFYITGSAGSNQVVATLVHGKAVKKDDESINSLSVMYPMPDQPEFDNTLNFLSTLSLGPQNVVLWDKPFKHLKTLVPILWKGKDKVFGLGGNSIPGILGQIGGALELAEQISNGEIPDPDEIYLALGSSCTTSGLIVGVCLARHLKLNAFRSPRFRIVSVLIHDGFAAIQRKTGAIKNKVGEYLSVSPRFGTQVVSKYLKPLIGVDLTDVTREFVEREWVAIDDAELIGKYGGHSKKSAEASSYDTKIKVTGDCPDWLTKPPQPWLCGHFTGKTFTAILERLEASKDPNLKILFWLTKSIVQPLGETNEWNQFKDLISQSPKLKKWSEEGSEHCSELRPGKIHWENGKQEDYAHIMTKIA